MTEIERKFLVKKLPRELAFASRKKIRQGYVSLESGGSEVRLREKADAWFLTVKSGDGMVRDEYEIELTRKQFLELWPSTLGRRIEKTRFFLPSNDALICVDQYDPPYAPLIVAEVEFRSVKASSRFLVPDWVDVEVTFDERFKNRNLVVSGLPKLD